MHGALRRSRSDVNEDVLFERMLVEVIQLSCVYVWNIDDNMKEDSSFIKYGVRVSSRVRSDTAELWN